MKITDQTQFSYSEPSDVQILCPVRRSSRFVFSTPQYSCGNATGSGCFASRMDDPSIQLRKRHPSERSIRSCDTARMIRTLDHVRRRSLHSTPHDFLLSTDPMKNRTPKCVARGV